MIGGPSNYPVQQNAESFYKPSCCVREKCNLLQEWRNDADKQRSEKKPNTQLRGSHNLNSPTCTGGYKCRGGLAARYRSNSAQYHVQLQRNTRQHYDSGTPMSAGLMNVEWVGLMCCAVEMNNGLEPIDAEATARGWQAVHMSRDTAVCNMYS